MDASLITNIWLHLQTMVISAQGFLLAGLIVLVAGYALTLVKRTTSSSIGTISYTISSASDKQSYGWGLAKYDTIISSNSNTYISSKGLNVSDVSSIPGLRFSQDSLAFPLLSAQQNGSYQSVGFQVIDASGKKTYGNKGFSMIGDFSGSPSKIYIAEGMATAGSVHRSTGSPTVIALDANGLASAHAHFSTAYPNAQVIIAADNDHFKARVKGIQNTGISKASVVGAYTYPVFSKNDKGTDWNDFEQRWGTFATSSLIRVNEHKGKS